MHARLSTRQNAKAFNQLLSFDTSSFDMDMSLMFYVRSARALAPTALSQAILVHAACAAVAPRPLTPHRACPPIDSAGRKLLVERQQAAHPLRLGGHLGLRFRWLWLELGSGDLPGHVHEHGLPEDGGPGLRR